MTEIVLGDDHVVFLDALHTVLTGRGYVVTATARSIAAVIEAVRTAPPDLCLLDRHLVDGDGVEAVTMLLDASPDTKVIMLTADRDAEGIGRALEYGAVGYVHKTRDAAALIGAIQRVLAGEIVIDVPTSKRLWRAADSVEAHRIAVHLTRRERQCLGMLVEGLSTAAMARQLDVSWATVRSHVQSLFTKLDAHSRLEVASLAVRLSLLEPAQDQLADESRRRPTVGR